MTTNKTPKRKRIHCHNCNKLFVPQKPWAKFCKENCRKEFHRYGSSYGPLKTGLERAIEKKYAALKKDFFAEIKDQSRRIDRVERMIDPLRQEYERHTHEFFGDPSVFEYETTIPKKIREEAQARMEQDARLSNERKPGQNKINVLRAVPLKGPDTSPAPPAHRECR